MDIKAQTHEVIQEVINFVHTSEDLEKIQEVAKLTRSLLYVIDDEKAPDYKMAIIMDYLEGLQDVLPTQRNTDLFNDFSHRKLHTLQEEAVNSVIQAIEQYIDPHLITPTLVVYWLKQSCDMDQLKKMDAFMLMLTKEQQAKAIKHDKSLAQEPGVQRLLQCLAKF